MPLKRLRTGSVVEHPRQPGDRYLRFTFKLWGQASPPDEALSDIRVFTGRFTGFSFRVLDLEQAEWVQPPFIPDGGPFPRRRNAPPGTDRDTPTPAWFDLGIEIEALPDPPEIIMIGGVPIIAHSYAVAIPEYNVLPRFSQAIIEAPIGSPDHPMVNPFESDLMLIQLAARDTPSRRSWYRGPRKIGTLGQVVISDRSAPFATLRLHDRIPAPVNFTQSPARFTGRLSETTRDPDRTTGISGAFLNIYDRTAEPEQVWDFAAAEWRDADPPLTPLQPAPPAHLELPLTSAGLGSYEFDTTWDYHEPGLYEAVLHALDRAGNENTVRAPFFIDDDEPIITFHSPHPYFEDPFVGPEVEIDVSVVELIGTWRHPTLVIRNLETDLYWDDASYGWSENFTSIELPERGGRMQYSFQPGLDSADLQIIVRAMDAAGNRAAAGRRVPYARYDVFPPTIRILEPANGSSHPSGQWRIGGLVRDNEQLADGGVALTIIPLSEGSNGIPLEGRGLELRPGPRGWLQWEASFDYSALPPDTYQVFVTAYDTRDNYADAEIIITVGET